MIKGETQIRTIITCSIELNLTKFDFSAGIAHVGAEKDCHAYGANCIIKTILHKKLDQQQSQCMT